MDQLDRLADEFNNEETPIYLEMVRFRRTDTGWLARVKDRVNDPLDDLTRRLGEAVGSEEMDAAIREMTRRLNDVSEWSIDPDEVLEDYREAGYEATDISEIRSLGLGEVEEVLEGTETKYRTVAAGEGAAAGTAGLAGAVAELPVIAATAMRAIDEYALHYGFPLDNEEDRHHGMLVLAAAASSGEARREALEQVSDYAEWMHGVPGLGQEVPTPTQTDIVERLVMRLARGALVQSLPVVGAVIGGGLDQWFLEEVCETAQHCYRERWLLRRYADQFQERPSAR